MVNPWTKSNGHLNGMNPWKIICTSGIVHCHGLIPGNALDGCLNMFESHRLICCIFLCLCLCAWVYIERNRWQHVVKAQVRYGHRMSQDVTGVCPLVSSHVSWHSSVWLSVCLCPNTDRR
jgi:hypothetical protein